MVRCMKEYSFLSHHWVSILILALQLNSCVTLAMLLNLS